MLVSTVIPCHNGVADTRVCIAALRAQQGADALEIVVVDNGSSDATGSLDREFAGVEIVRLRENTGFAGGVNRGVAAAQGELVLVLNNDTRAAPHMVARLLHALRSDPGIGAVAPVSNHVKGPAMIPVGAAGATDHGCRRIEQALGETFPGVLQDVDTLAGLCLLLRRDFFADLGGFDERFGIGNYEDDDLCLRARLRGARLVLARDAFLHHEGHRTFDALGVDYRDTLLERRRQFDAKWRHDPAGRAVLAHHDGDRLTAAEHAARGLREHPSWPDGHWLAARHPRRAAADCLPHLRALIAAAPFHSAGHTELACRLVESGDRTRGLAHLAWTLAQCFVSDENAAATFARLARGAAKTGDRAAALEWMQSAADLRPTDGELRNELGTELMEGGRLEAALACLLEAERLGGRYGATNAGICLWRAGRHLEAMQAFRRAAATAPDDPVIAGNLATAQAAMGPPARSALPVSG